MAVIFVMEDVAAAKPSELTKLLINEGYHTLSLRSAQETLSTLRCVRPNVLVIDVSPGHTAVAGATEVLESIRQDPTYATLQVLVVSAGAAECGELRGNLKAGRGDPYLDAASSPDALVSRVRERVEPMTMPFN